MPLAGGILQHGYQCGMIWGAALAAGAQAYRLFGPGPRAETQAILTARRLVTSFRAAHTHVNCFDLTGLNKTSSTMQMVTYFLMKGGTIRCLNKAVRYVRPALAEIESALGTAPSQVPTTPVGCATKLASRMGLSDMQTIMAAGLSGGIGLSGGGCGALGAAVWIIGMNQFEAGAKPDLNSPRAVAAIDRFSKCTGAEFECRNIVGHRFETVADHAAYVRDGGCSTLIELMAAS